MLVSRAARAREHAGLSLSRGAGTETCATEEELRRAVVARLGYDPFDGAPNAPFLRVRFERNGTAFAASIERAADGTRDEGGRRLTSTRCSDLLAPTAIALSIAVDPLATPVVPGAEEPIDPLPPPHPSTPTLPAPASEPPRTPSEPMVRWRVELAVSTHIAFGSAPAAAAGFTAAVGVRRRAVSLLVEGRADLPASTRAGGGEVSAQLVAASLVPCLHRSFLAGCGLLTLGTVLGEGRAVATPTRDSSLYAAVGGRLGVQVPIGERLYVALRGDVVVAPERTILRLNGVDAWTSPVFNTVAAIAAGGTF